MNTPSQDGNSPAHTGSPVSLQHAGIPQDSPLRDREKLQSLLETFAVFAVPGKERFIGNLATAQSDPLVLHGLLSAETQPLSQAVFNQFLGLAGIEPMSPDVMRHYFCEVPERPTYNVKALPGFDQIDLVTIDNRICSVPQLQWGMHRLFTDLMLHYGNIERGYNELRKMNREELEGLFANRRFDTEALKERGRVLGLRRLNPEFSYLIGEQVGKCFGIPGQEDYPNNTLEEVLSEAFAKFARSTEQTEQGIKLGQLFQDQYYPESRGNVRYQCEYTAAGIGERTVTSLGELKEAIGILRGEYEKVRAIAERNTDVYLAASGDLDIYFATSMRSPEDFRTIHEVCRAVSWAPKVEDLHLRYFDPTISNAADHIDKGLVECTMVHAAKAFVYIAGEKDSYGKAAEASMALSEGKPTIFLCESPRQAYILRDVHPLTRLVDWSTGAPNGALVTNDREEVVELLSRTFRNEMEYTLEQRGKGGFLLRDALTGSIVCSQSSNPAIADAVWRRTQIHKEG